MPARLNLAWWFLLGTVAAVASGASEPAMRASNREVRGAVIAVISGQLAAFRQGELAKAYGYAAAEFRAQKPLSVFAAIVREHYPEIWANTRAEYGIVRDDGRRATVTVLVFSRTAEAAYDFTLAKEDTGWRIVRVLRHQPRAAGKA